MTWQDHRAAPRKVLALEGKGGPGPGPDSKPGEHGLWNQVDPAFNPEQGWKFHSLGLKSLLLSKEDDAPKLLVPQDDRSIMSRGWSVVCGSTVQPGRGGAGHLPLLWDRAHPPLGSLSRPPQGQAFLPKISCPRGTCPALSGSHKCYGGLSSSQARVLSPMPLCFPDLTVNLVCA